MATNSTGSFSSILSADQADLRYLLTITDRAGMFQHPVFAAGYLGRADMSTTVQRPVYGLGADLMAAETEGTGASGTTIADSTVSATVAGQILVRENTSLLRNVTGDALSPSELFGMDMAVAASSRFLSMVCSAMGSLTTNESTTGVALTAATHFAAVAKYRALGSLGVDASGAPIAVYHVKQVSDLETNLAVTLAAGQLQIPFEELALEPLVADERDVPDPVAGSFIDDKGQQGPVAADAVHHLHFAAHPGLEEAEAAVIGGQGVDIAVNLFIVDIAAEEPKEARLRLDLGQQAGVTGNAVADKIGPE